jgi:hypothetical protein
VATNRLLSVTTREEMRIQAAAHVTSEIAAIEELRRAAGVSGQSTQCVYVDSRRTLYSRVGDVLPWALVIFTGAGLLAALFQTTRPAFRRRS